MYYVEAYCLICKYLGIFHIFFCCLFVFVVAISWAAPAAYGGTQARGQIGAVATSLRQSQVCNLHHSSRQRRIVNPLSKGRDRTLNLMIPSWIR